MKKIIIAHGHSSLEIFHSLFPFLLQHSSKAYTFQYVDYRIADISNYSGDIIIIVRKYQVYNLRHDYCVSELISLRKKFNKIVYFDDSAAISYIMFNIIDYVDQYWVRGLLKDKQLYLRSFYGGRTFSDYYHTRYSVFDHFPTVSPTCTAFPVDKVKIAWNIGVGCFPFSSSNFASLFYGHIKKLSCILSMASANTLVSKIVHYYYSSILAELEKPLLTPSNSLSINSRFSFSSYTSTVGFQRKTLLSKIADYSHFNYELLPFSRYLSTMENDFAILSPFGWGEICYRDFEAIIFSKLLIKPSMKHIETWPNIYTSECYYSLDWDFNDITLCSDPQFLTESIIQSKICLSRRVYHSALLQVVDRLNSLLDSL